jgi:hypothetical protein
MLILRRLCISLFIFSTIYPLIAQKRDTLRLMHYNVLKYGEAGCAAIATKDGLLSSIFSDYRPDILTLNEIAELPGIAAKFRSGTLQYNSAMTPGLYSNSSNSNIVNLLFYNADKIGLLGQTAITGNIRDIDVFELFHKGSTVKGDTSKLWYFIAHFKSSQGFENEREAAAKDVTTWLKNHPEVENYVFSGDFNLYSSTEPAWKALTTSSNGNIWFKDPSGQSTGWDGANFAYIHTQSPSDGVNDCSVTGGMDNRFDFILVNPEMLLAGNPVSVVANTYRAFGNDGVSYNTALDCAETTSVSSQVCFALKRASDHLPVVMGLSFPTRSSADEAPYYFTIFDNPGPANSGKLRLKMNTNVGGTYFWDIFDVLGRYLGRGRIDVAVLPEETFEINIPSLSQGAYFLRIRDNEGNKSTKTFVLIP